MENEQAMLEDSFKHQDDTFEEDGVVYIKTPLLCKILSISSASFYNYTRTNPDNPLVRGKSSKDGRIVGYSADSVRELIRQVRTGSITARMFADIEASVEEYTELLKLETNTETKVEEPVLRIYGEDDPYLLEDSKFPLVSSTCYGWYSELDEECNSHCKFVKICAKARNKNLQALGRELEQDFVVKSQSILERLEALTSYRNTFFS